jgi:putative membrane protein
MGRVVSWGLMLLVPPTLIFAVAEYFAFRYQVAGDELILNSGVLSRRHRVVPLSRVQNLELRQNPLQRALGVAELRVETASGEGEESVPLVLDQREAERLRTELLARRDAAPADDSAPTPPSDQLAHLSPRDLVLAGATANEAGVIAAALVGVLELAYQLPIGMPGIPLNPRAFLPDLPVLGAVLWGLAAVATLFAVAMLLSIAGALFGYWDFVLERAGGELHKRYGWLDRRVVVVPLARVQALRVEESLLRRPLGLASLRIETASASPGKAKRGGAEAFLPVVRAGDVPRLAAAVFDGFNYGELTFRPVHPYARRRAFYRYAAVVLALAAGATILFGPAGSWLLLLLIPAVIAARAHHQHLGYALTPGYVAARSGFWNRVTWIVPERKVQTLHLRQTLFQRRNGVATVITDTAAGEARVPDIARAEAHALLTHVSERVEAGRRTGESAVGERPESGRRTVE